MGAQIVEHRVVVDQPRDRMAAARAAKRLRAETRNRLRALKQAYYEKFEDYLRLAEQDDAPAAEIRAARSQAWDAHSVYAHEQLQADRELAHVRGGR